MRKSLLVLASLALLLAFGTLARTQDKSSAKVAGNWQLTLQTGNAGGSNHPLVLEQNGNNITGKIENIPLNGTVNGSDIAFTIRVQTQNGDADEAFKGTVDGDSMMGKVTLGTASADWSATRR